MSTRNISLGVKAAGAYGWKPYRLHVPTVLKSGSFWNPRGVARDCCTLKSNKVVLLCHWKSYASARAFFTIPYMGHLRHATARFCHQIHHVPRSRDPVHFKMKDRNGQSRNCNFEWHNQLEKPQCRSLIDAIQALRLLGYKQCIPWLASFHMQQSGRFQGTFCAATVP